MTAKKKSGKKIIVFIAIGAAVLGFALFAVLSRGGNAVTEVEPHTVALGSLDREISANGVIQARDSETLVAQVSGPVIRLPVKKGQAVGKGTLLVLLDQEKILVQEKEAKAMLATTRRNIRVELLNLRTAFAQARADREQAARDLKTATELQAVGSASEEQLTRARDRDTVTDINLTAARQRLNEREGRPKDDPRETSAAPDDRIVENSVEVKQSEAQLESIRTTLSRTEIRSAISGVVTELPVEVGSVVAPGTRLAVVADPRSLEVSSNIDEVDLGYLALGQEARIESDVFLNRLLTGRVSFIAPAIVKAGDARVCEIKIGFMDPERLARIGASCSVYITVARRENVPALPLELYLQEGKKRFVFRLEPAGAPADEYLLRKAEIETGVLGLDAVEITGGLKPGDQVARGELKLFRDGQRVKLKPRAPQNGRRP